MAEISRRLARKLDKLTLPQVREVLEESCGKIDMMESVFQSVGTGLVIVDCQRNSFRVLMVNKAAERFVPFVQKMDGLPVWDCVTDKGVSTFLRDNIGSGKTNVSDEFTMTTPGGSVRFVVVSISPFITDARDGLIGSIVRIDDVTERRNQEILLHRMESLASLTNVAASVAHEIKNPLGAISIHIQLMQKAIRKKRAGDGMLPDPKFAEDYLDVVNSEIERLNKIVVDFLMAVRPLSVRMELSEPNALLSEFVSFFAPEFSASGIGVRTEFCEKCPRILLDGKLFREIFVNMAQNAISAINSRFPDGHGGLFGVSTTCDGDSFVVRFSDNGCGMDGETCARVFEPYFTTKADGTGLGMAMVYKIIKEFGGDIRVDSVQGEGTEFVVTLPVPQKDKRLLSYKTE